MSSTPLAPLNDPQARAVAHVRGPLLVFAGAGSGKTRVITYRIANLVARERVAPYRILAVTFTNKAAGEMRARLEGLLGPELAKELWVGTFHATCAKLLRRYGDAVGVPRNFVIYDSHDQKAVVSRVLKELDLDDRRYPPRAVLHRILAEKQEGRGPGDMSLDNYMDDAIQKIYRRYDEQLTAAGAVDFEDLIGKTVQVLEEGKSEHGAALRRKFEYVLVDEFQDTNAMQYRLLRGFVGERQNLCVVGDDDQSIYGWRGADVRNIRGFRHDFPAAEVVKLEQNYRSTSNIVRAALGVIAPSREREPKELWTENEAGAPVLVVAVRDEHEEAATVVRALKTAREEGVDLRQMAIFYRVHAQSRVLEEALRQSNVPYQIVGGTKFYERAEIKDALAYLRVLVNPKSDVDLLRIVNSPPRGIGQTTVERLVAFATQKKITVFDALARVGDVTEIAGAAQKRLVQFRDLLGKLQTLAEHTAPSQLLADLLQAVGYREALQAEDSAESDARLENLAELVGSIQDYESEMSAAGEAPSLEGYLERITLQADIDTMTDEGKVTMMTVHGAKGLEFERVFLTGMEEDMFPYRGMDPGRGEETEEERRLAYVAVTRARHQLMLTHAGQRQIFGTTRFGRPSRFIADLPAEVVVHKGTRLGASYVERPARTIEPLPWELVSPGSSRGSAPPPSRARPLSRPPVEPGERYVDREYFQDDSSSDDAVPLRRGSRVLHDRFGEGVVKRVIDLGEPAVVADFPGWGEKKVIARFLKRA
jgi:DNA helicase-2/ATP-dependent DNA helicase PcrA